MQPQCGKLLFIKQPTTLHQRVFSFNNWNKDNLRIQSEMKHLEQKLFDCKTSSTNNNIKCNNRLHGSPTKSPFDSTHSTPHRHDHHYTSQDCWESIHWGDLDAAVQGAEAAVASMSDSTLQEESGRRGDSLVVLHQICTPVDTLQVWGILVEGRTSDV